MTKKEKIITAVYAAIDQLNELLPENSRLEKSLYAPLVDKSGKLDSLAIVNLVVATEEKIDEIFNSTISLIEGITNLQEHNHFETVGSLVEYILDVLEEN